jgi:hypothetical protein
MGVLVMTCPVTGKEFSTGLQIDEKDVIALPDYEAATLCPYCNSFIVGVLETQDGSKPCGHPNG